MLIPRRELLRGGLAGFAAAMMSRALPGCGDPSPGAGDAGVGDAGVGDAGAGDVGAVADGGSRSYFEPRAVPAPPALGIFKHEAAAVDTVNAHVDLSAGRLEVALVGDAGVGRVTWQRGLRPLVQVVGHDTSEVTGPAFDPGGTRLYFSSQRGPSTMTGGGWTFEVQGPFHAPA